MFKCRENGLIGETPSLPGDRSNANYPSQTGPSNGILTFGSRGPITFCDQLIAFGDATANYYSAKYLI